MHKTTLDKHLLPALWGPSFFKYLPTFFCFGTSKIARYFFASRKTHFEAIQFPTTDQIK